MKKIFRKNQLVITALALMIAVAGYFSYINSNVKDDKVAASAEVDPLTGNEYEISDEEIFTDEGTGDEIAEITYEDSYVSEEDVTDVSSIDADAATDSQTDVENPGEAILTGANVSGIDYAAEMKLTREQVRSKNKEALLEIINNTTISDELKQDALNKVVAMTDTAEREAAAEMLLEAKGFTDVVVSITDAGCDVVLNMGEVTDAKRAQVEDIVKRKTNVEADKIVITPIVTGN